jgi:hypothetical protein
MAGRVVQERAVQAVLDSIKSIAQVAEKKWSSRSLRHRTRNYCAWTVSGNEILPPPLEKSVRLETEGGCLPAGRQGGI